MHAARLWQLGVRPGDVVAWQLPNWWEAVAFCWGIWRCGAIASPITPSLGVREVGFVLRQTGARVAAVPATFRAVDYVALMNVAGFDGELIVMRDGADPVWSGDSAPDFAPEVNAPALVLWTSGTTAEPKGVVHTHQSLRHEADSIVAAHAMTQGERLLLPMPITHVAGLTYGVLLPVTNGITAVLMDRWEAQAGIGAARDRARLGHDQHAGVHADDDRPLPLRDDGHELACGCSRSAGRACHRPWCARARPASTAGASGPTDRRNTRR